MANRLKGEVDFEVNGKTYTARLTVNALVEAEGLGVDINDTDGLQRLGTMRTILWAALRGKHPDLTLEAVGDLMTEAGVARSAEIVGEALKAAFPEAAVTSENPQTPSPTGTGSA